MSGPRSTADLVGQWTRGLDYDTALALERVRMLNATTIEAARELPPSIDRRCADLLLTRLQEAEHWILDAARAHIEAADRARESSSAGGPTQ